MRPAPRAVRCTVRLATAAAAATLVAGCAAGLDSLPLLAPGGASRTFSVVAEFSNALNLPARAKVKLNGADIGEVDSIRAGNFTALVTMRIRSDVQLRTGCTTELRSATPLGDVFVAIKPAPNQPADAPLLRDGATIPLKSTSSAPSLEEVLSSAALLVNGGAVRYLVSVVNGAGTAVGGRGAQVAALLQQSNTLLARLNARSEQIRAALRATSDLAATLSAHEDTLNAAINAAGPAIGVVADNTDQLVETIDTVARITGQLSRFPSLQGTDTRSLIADLNHLSETFNDIAVDPNVSLTPFNRSIPILMKFLDSTAGHVDVTLAKLAIGNHPDKNYPGDPATHGPDGTDYHAMVGSLRYEWNLLLDKIYGPQR